jgi:MFS transporter, DHA2 family, multidrug resistance protein
MFGVGIAAIDSFGHGKPSAYYLSELAIAALAGCVLLRRQRGVAYPLLPVDLFRIPIFRLSMSASISAFCAQSLALLALPFYLRASYGFSAVDIGLLITPWPVALAITAPIAGRLVERYSAGFWGELASRCLR